MLDNFEWKRPSFLSGIAKMADWDSLLLGHYRFLLDEKADYNAIFSDWVKIENDINHVRQSFAIDLREENFLNEPKA